MPQERIGEGGFSREISKNRGGGSVRSKNDCGCFFIFFLMIIIIKLPWLSMAKFSFSKLDLVLRTLMYSHWSWCYVCFCYSLTLMIIFIVNARFRLICISLMKKMKKYKEVRETKKKKQEILKKEKYASLKKIMPILWHEMLEKERLHLDVKWSRRDPATTQDIVAQSKGVLAWYDLYLETFWLL